MDSTIYKDIAARTGGDIYIGVVGPVRTGKSTFIRRFMESVVLPQMTDDARRERATDELPQASAGRTIMTTEPKFIPEEAVCIRPDAGTEFFVRLIDCVGYIVPSSLGYIENEAPRMVTTPWFEQEIPFNMAAEVGTRKVITEHSTVGLVVTTDGSISDIPREEYAEAEQRVVAELKELDKPFVVLLNCVTPDSDEAQTLRAELQQQYGVPVMAVNCTQLEEADIRSILQQLLYRFPIREIAVEIPAWIVSLPTDHWLRSSLFETVCETARALHCIGELVGLPQSVTQNQWVRRAELARCDYGTGKATLEITVQPELFFRVLSERVGREIADESSLFAFMENAAAVFAEYEKYRGAIEQVNATGYGIVMPEMHELTLAQPEIMRQSGKYGVRLKATAPSIHMLRADIQTEISPIVGTERQSEELVSFLLKDYEQAPESIWQSNIFGKSLHELVNEGLHAKLAHMPLQARVRLQETIQRVINEGCNSLICIIL
ncbi:MAG: stage IV sporulation protein A [Clostridia bacterium]|nr:stage IV sporulation protein A [Clostridia bacterium]